MGGCKSAAKVPTTVTSGDATASAGIDNSEGCRASGDESHRGAHIVGLRKLAGQDLPTNQGVPRRPCHISLPGPNRPSPWPSAPGQADPQGPYPARCETAGVSASAAISTSRLVSRSMRLPGFQKRVLFQHIHPAGIGGYEDIRRRTLLNLAGQHPKIQPATRPDHTRLRLRTPVSISAMALAMLAAAKNGDIIGQHRGGQAENPAQAPEPMMGREAPSCHALSWICSTKHIVGFAAPSSVIFQWEYRATRLAMPGFALRLHRPLAASIARYCARTAKAGIRQIRAPPLSAPPREDATSGSQKAAFMVSTNIQARL